MIVRLAVLAVLMATFGLPQAVNAQQVDRVAAVVNDEIITLRDVESRLRMAMVLSGLPDSQEARKRALPQVMRKMIDERLQIQEANRLKISLTAAEVEMGIANIEEQSRQPKGSLVATLAQAGVDPASIREQIRADLTWIRVVSRVLGSSIRVGDEEVKDRLGIIQERQGQPEYLAAEIFLPIESPGQEEDIIRLADRLLEQLRAGAPFANLARQFSRAPTAANGGQMGWLTEGLADDDLIAMLRPMSPGSVSKPIRAGDGIHIVALLDRRIAGGAIDANDTAVTLSRIVLPVPTDGPTFEQLTAHATDLTRGAKTCDEHEATGRKLGATLVGRLPSARLSELAPHIRGAVAPLAAGTVARPVSTPEGLLVLMVCERKDAVTVQLPSMAAVRRMIEDERMDMLTRRYLRDLRRSAFIEIRL